MEKVDFVEENISHSFRKVKVDIIRLQDEFMQLRQTQVRLLSKLAKLEYKKPVKVVKVVKAKKAKKPVKTKKAKKVKKTKKT